MSDTTFAANSRNTHIKTHFISRLMERVRKSLHICIESIPDMDVVDERLKQHYGEEGIRQYLKKGRHARVIQDTQSPWAIDLFLDFAMVFLFFGTPFAYLRHVNEFFITGTLSLSQRLLSNVL